MPPFSFRAILRALVGAALLPAWSAAAWKHFDPSDTSQVPKRFSQTGFYTAWQAKIVTPEAAAFDVNSPLWSDHAVKSRWILLKEGSAKVRFDPDSDYWEYPDGAVFVKLFRHDTLAGDTASRIWWETRVLVNKEGYDSSAARTFDSWYAFSYKWRPDGSEAFLVPRTGLDTFLSVRSGGKRGFRKWSFPSAGACNECHRQYEKDRDAFQGRAILGFFTPQLNRPAVGSAGVTQIAELFRKGILGRAGTAPSETELAAMPKWARPEDESASLDLRARAYIAANCSGCHGMRGLATHATPNIADLDYDFFKRPAGAGAGPIPSMELRNVSVGVWDLRSIIENGRTVEPALIVPGHPELSVLLYRMRHRNTLPPGEMESYAKAEAQMPPLGVFVEDTVATAMIARWIRGLPEQVSIRKGMDSKAEARGPRVRGGGIWLGVDAGWTGLDGRRP
jgi:hypothetical protein